MDSPYSTCKPCNSLFFPHLGGLVHLCLVHTETAQPVNMSTGRCLTGQQVFEAGLDQQPEERKE